MIIDGLHEKNILDKDFPFRLVNNQEINFDYPFHWHNEIEIIYVLENTFAVIVNNTEYTLGEKEILFIPGGDIHGFRDHCNHGGRLFIQFDTSDLSYYTQLHLIRPVLQQVTKITPAADPDLHGYVEKALQAMVSEYTAKDFAYQLSLMARCLDILTFLSRNIVNRMNQKSLQSGKKKIAGLSKINQAFRFIEANFDGEIDLKEVAKAAGFSEFHFSRIFKEITGKNFHQYLIEFRIRKAQKYLIDPETTIIQAAYAAGFRSIATFNRLFKESMGCTPGAYRKMYI
jgi:AraC-like DNA-binding protein